MKRLVIVSAGFFALVLWSGCVAQIERPTKTPDVMATLVAAPPVTLEPPTPTTTPVPDPTPTPVPPIPTPIPLVPLFLDIQSPSFGAIIRTDVLTVVGITQPQATVKVNSKVVRADEGGRFEVDVNLTQGQNSLAILVTGADGSQLRDFVTVQYNPPPPPTPPLFFLVVDQPGNVTIVGEQPVLVVGRTSLQARVTVNGVGVLVDDNGGFSTLVALSPGNNLIRVVALHPQGRTLTSNVSLIYDP